MHGCDGEVVRQIDSCDPTIPDVVLNLPPGPAAVHVPHRESLAVQRFEGLRIISGCSFDTDVDGQPASTKGKNVHAASFSYIACAEPWLPCVRPQRRLVWINGGTGIAGGMPRLSSSWIRRA